MASPALSLKVTDQIPHLCKEFVSCPGGFPVELRSYQREGRKQRAVLFSVLMQESTLAEEVRLCVDMGSCRSLPC